MDVLHNLVVLMMVAITSVASCQQDCSIKSCQFTDNLPDETGELDVVDLYLTGWDINYVYICLVIMPDIVNCPL